MAIGTARKSKAAEERRLPDKVIDRQLTRVRRHIRVTDLISGFMTLAAGLLMYLLLVVLVDHWLFDLGTAFRWLALLVLIIGPAWFFATRILPGLLRGINPAFAAQTIERSEPTLKNSVVNYLLLRRDRAALHEVVFQAVQQQAAADVSHVAVEQTVDRSAVIKAGYVLVAVMAVSAAYKILSPKDPVQTVRRIVAPWADIVRPARVLISDVQPGDAKVLHGDKLIVSALVRGVKDQDRVALLYSTEDGQLVDRELRMKLDSSGLRHTVEVTPEGEGLEQSLVYRIVAGDTSTANYHVEILSAPTIQIDSVEYDYPAYTRRPREVVRQQGDLKAIEGTRVTIRAQTNQPIQTATFHLQAAESATAADRTSSKVVQQFPMEFQGSDTWRQIILELSDDRRTPNIPKYSAYHLAFTNALGQSSQRPVVHRIEVVPDLAPEVEILTPDKQRLEVPLSGSQPIEIRAIDPDYGLSQLRLKATVAGKEILNESLMGGDATQPGQLITTFDFQPKQWKLAVDDQVSYWAEAADNRTAVNSDSPAPNVSRSRTFHFVIVADPPPQQADPDSGKAADQQKPAEKAPAKGVPQNSKKGEPKPGDPNSQQPTEPGSPTERQPNGDKPQQPNSDQTGKQEQGKGEKGQQNNKSQGSKSPETKSGNEKGGASDSPSGAEESTQSGNSGKSGGVKPNDTKPMPGQGTGGNQTGGNTPQQTGESSQEPTPGNNSDAQGEYRDAQSDGQRTEPLHDGEVFERALNKMKGNQNSADGSETAGDNQAESSGSKSNENQPRSDDAQSKGNTQQTTSDKSNATASTEQKKGDKGSDGDKEGDKGTKSDKGTEAGKAQGSDKKQAEQGNATGKNASEKNPAEKGQSKQPGQEKGEGEKSKQAAGEDAQSEDKKGEQGQPGGEPKPGDAKHADKNQGEGELKKGASGEGGKSARGGQERPEESSKEKGQEKSTDEGGKEPGTSDNGQSGAGKNSKDKTGSGSVEESQGEKVQNSDRQKDPAAENQTPQKESDNGASTSKKQSDSKGGESGDKSGGGKKGSGQGAKQPGNDSAGSQSSSDDGAGKSQESGKGETADSPGGKKSSQTPTGQAGDKKGAGSGATESADGQQSGETPESKGQQPPPGGPPKPPQNGAKGGSAAGGHNAPPNGGGLPGENPGGAPPPNTEVPAGDAANLDYANRATDLVLDYLRDQQDKPDRELLDELGWTNEDLKAFLNRWQGLKDKAVEDPNAKRELDESLRSLGIQPARDIKRKGAQRTDDARGLRESGIDSKPPAMYQDQFRAFKKGAARGK
jgi:hypothetical protein